MNISWGVVCLVVVISVVILLRSRVASRVRLATLIFALVSVVIYGGAYLLWAVGVVALHKTAAAWAIGLNAINLGIGVLVSHWLGSEPAASPPQREDAPPV